MLAIFILTFFCIVCGKCDKLDEADAFLNRGRIPEALKLYMEVAKEEHSTSNYPFALQGAASCFIEMKQFSSAGEYFFEAGKSIGNPQLFFNSGMAFAMANDMANAVKSYDKCISYSNGKRVAYPCHIKLASYYRDGENFELVQQHLYAAMEVDPNQPDTYAYLGDVLNNRKFFNKSIEMYMKAIRLQPQNPNLWNSIGDSYINSKRFNESYTAFSHALSLSSGNKNINPLESVIGKYFAGLEFGHWLKFEFYGNFMVRSSYNHFIQQQHRMEVTPSLLSPYRLLFLEPKAEEFHALASSWAAALVTGDQLPSVSLPVASTHTPIRIGYISRRFTDYPGTQMMLRIFEKHNRSRTQVFSFANGPDDQLIYRAIIQNTSDVFVDTSELSPLVAAGTIRSHNVDILIDYDGLHDFNNIKVLSHRPSVSVQATWLGFAGTTGLGGRVVQVQRSHEANSFCCRDCSAMDPTACIYQPENKKVIKPTLDYIIADRFVIPPDTLSNYYSESMLYLPGSYQPQDNLRNSGNDDEAAIHFDVGLLSDKPNSSTALRYDLLVKYVHDDAVVWYGESANSSKMENSFLKIAAGKWLTCFNRVTKITPDVIEDWFHVMRQSSGPRKTYLLLMSESVEVKAKFRHMAAYWGILPSRIVFIPRVSKVDYETVLALSDLFLDTRYYNAHTVATDAMRFHIPVLTLPGITFASRVGLSLNTAAFHADATASVVDWSSVLIVDNRKQYIDTAARLCVKKSSNVPDVSEVTDAVAYPVPSFPYLSAARTAIERSNENAHGLFNNTLFTQRLEHGYAAMLEMSSLTRVNEHFHVFFASDSVK